MPLYSIIDDINIVQLSLDDIYLLPNIVETSNIFNSTELIIPTNDTKVLYVTQGEIATNVKTNIGLFDIIGSDDATTCHLLFAKSNKSNRLLCTHIDSSNKCNGINFIIDELILSNVDDDYIDIYIIGGLDDELSNDITKLLLNQIDKTIFKCILKLLCVNKLNIIEKNNIMYPMNLGAGFDINHNTIKRMFFNKNKKEPNYLLRNARSYEITDDIYSLKIVYNGNINDYFCISCFSIIEDINPIVMRYYLSLSDNELLLSCSTSPNVEPKHFVSDMRETFLFISNKDNICDSFQQKDLYYKIKDNGEWEKIL